MKLENVWMLLPGRKVGFGTIETEGDAISSVSLREPGKSDRLVLPGLVNCHCHAPMTLLRGVGGGLPLKRWLEEAIFPLEAKLTDEDVHAGALWGAMEMLAGGTTIVADMYEWNYQHAFLEAGMRARVTTVGRLGAPGRLAECIERTRSWNERMRGEARGDVYMDICVHSEYLTDEHFCRELAAANRELGRRLHVHVSETRREHEECVARHGKTPIAYLADTGLLDRGGYAAHCVWCTDDDFRIMAERDVSLVHNPTSNMKLGSGFARIVRAMELGVNVALGTDGTASNDNLDMFEEMHIASLVHKGLNLDPTVLSAWEVIEMATKNGAKALGLANTGEIAVGKAADLCVVDLDAVHLAPAIDIPNLVVNSMGAGDVAMTVIDGRVVYEKGVGYDGWAAAEDARERLEASVGRLFA